MNYELDEEMLDDGYWLIDTGYWMMDDFTRLSGKSVSGRIVRGGSGWRFQNPA